MARCMHALQGIGSMKLVVLRLRGIDRTLIGQPISEHSYQRLELFSYLKRAFDILPPKHCHPTGQVRDGFIGSRESTHLCLHSNALLP